MDGCEACEALGAELCPQCAALVRETGAPGD